MKILTLNIWGGRAGHQPLLDFFKAHNDVDIFCLQEIWSAPYEHLNGQNAGGVALDHNKIMTYALQEISKQLPNHTAYFKPHHLDNYGLLMLVKNSIPVLEEGDVFVYRERGYIPEGDVGNHARNLQYVTISAGGTPVTVMNFHGLWNGQGKGDTDDRIKQSENIINFLGGLPGEHILCGDFNLLPDTRSLKMIEDAGMKNLITEFGITSTRTSLYTKPVPFADYILTSSGITIKHFTVLPEEVSDHAPLLLEI